MAHLALAICPDVMLRTGWQCMTRNRRLKDAWIPPYAPTMRREADPSGAVRTTLQMVGAKAAL